MLSCLISRARSVIVRQKFYLFQIRESKTIDFKNVLCFFKYINHFCELNCLAEVWFMRERERIRLMIARDIRIDDSLKISYNISSTRARNCLCKSENCQYRSTNNEVNTTSRTQILQELRHHEKKEETVSRIEKKDSNSQLDCHQYTFHVFYFSSRSLMSLKDQRFSFFSRVFLHSF